MKTITSEKSQSLSITKRVLYSWVFWISLINLIWIIFGKVYYYYDIFLSVIFIGAILLLPLAGIFIAAIIMTLINVIKELTKYMKKKTIDSLPFILLLFQISIITFSSFVPVLDYFTTYVSDLDKLSLYVENLNRTKGLGEEYIEIEVPQSLKRISDRYVNASAKDGLVKINVRLTGSAISRHIFLLYRSDGKEPDQEDLRNSAPHKSTYQRKSEKWFQVDMND
jgi:hypothetical protein